MRKYFKQQFNAKTSYIIKGKSKKESFFRECLITYVEDSFPELLSPSKDTDFLLSEFEINDQFWLENCDPLLFIGSFLYPKHSVRLLWEPYLAAGLTRPQAAELVEVLHSTMKDFNLEKLRKLTSIDTFNRLFTSYHREAVL